MKDYLTEIRMHYKIDMPNMSLNVQGKVLHLCTKYDQIYLIKNELVRLI